ncbi:hypothetical protein BZARG_2348 [Bizionia argentinensis JUB59]|uniref:DUF3575 domain-containing protein n=1 Tax=Bizionia argentinensis JUB59 TaxID=1046627 RepID=G2ECA6_9FLAO|nr:DUF6048 family protein [Bizionia argentinensis]EGV43934.2 hypothetical protein BZARG_2348 [Bizionia argentinensis JUB59]
MRKQQTLASFIRTIFIGMLFCSVSFAQSDSIPKNKKLKDSSKQQEKYGLRLGGDASKLIRSFLDDDYKGFEINGDFRFMKKLYLAGEFGIEEKRTTTDYIDATASGTYIKLGVDYNAYENWYGMNNLLYGGFRVAASNFSQKLDSFGVYSQNQYWAPQFTSSETKEFSGLNAVWAEIIVGLKVEVLTNLFLGVNAQFKYIISEKEPGNFENIYIPGYNKTYDSGSFGFGYGYNVSYLIPLFKKAR